MNYQDYYMHRVENKSHGWKMSAELKIMKLRLTLRLLFLKCIIVGEYMRLSLKRLFYLSECRQSILSFLFINIPVLYSVVKLKVLVQIYYNIITNYSHHWLCLIFLTIIPTCALLLQTLRIFQFDGHFSTLDFFVHHAYRS